MALNFNCLNRLLLLYTYRGGRFNKLALSPTIRRYYESENAIEFKELQPLLQTKRLTMSKITEIEKSVIGKEYFHMLTRNWIKIHNENVVSFILQCCEQNDATNFGYKYYKKLVESGKKMKVTDHVLFFKFMMNNLELCHKNKDFIYKQYCNLRDTTEVMDDATVKSCVSLLCCLDKKWKEAIDLVESKKELISNVNELKAIIAAAAFKHNEIELGWDMLQSAKEKPLVEALVAYIVHLKESVVKNTFNMKKLDRLFQFMQDKQVSLQKSDINFYVELKNVTELLNKHYEKDYVWSISQSTADRETGFCPSCDKSLNNMQLDNKSFSVLRSAFFNDVLVGKDINIRSSHAEAQKFYKFLCSTSHFDVVLDGLNIAYRNHNNKTNNSSVKIESILRAINYFKQRNLKVLLIGRHHMKFWPNFKEVQHRCSVYLFDNSTDDDAYLIYAAMFKGLNTYICTGDFLRGKTNFFNDPKLTDLFEVWQKTHQYGFDAMKYIVPPMNHTLFTHKIHPTNQSDTGEINYHIACTPSEFSITGYNFEVNLFWICLQRTSLEKAKLRDVKEKNSSNNYFAGEPFFNEEVLNPPKAVDVPADFLNPFANNSTTDGGLFERTNFSPDKNAERSQEPSKFLNGNKMEASDATTKVNNIFRAISSEENNIFNGRKSTNDSKREGENVSDTMEKIMEGQMFKPDHRKSHNRSENWSKNKNLSDLELGESNSKAFEADSLNEIPSNNYNSVKSSWDDNLAERNSRKNSFSSFDRKGKVAGKNFSREENGDLENNQESCRYFDKRNSFERKNYKRRTDFNPFSSNLSDLNKNKTEAADVRFSNEKNWGLENNESSSEKGFFRSKNYQKRAETDRLSEFSYLKSRKFQAASSSADSSTNNEPNSKQFSSSFKKSIVRKDETPQNNLAEQKSSTTSPEEKVQISEHPKAEIRYAAKPKPFVSSFRKSDKPIWKGPAAAVDSTKFQKENTEVKNSENPIEASEIKEGKQCETAEKVLTPGKYLEEENISEVAEKINNSDLDSENLTGFEKPQKISDVENEDTNSKNPEPKNPIQSNKVGLSSSPLGDINKMAKRYMSSFKKSYVVKNLAVKLEDASAESTVSTSTLEWTPSAWTSDAELNPESPEPMDYVWEDPAEEYGDDFFDRTLKKIKDEYVLKKNELEEKRKAENEFFIDPSYENLQFSDSKEKLHEIAIDIVKKASEKMVGNSSGHNQGTLEKDSVGLEEDQLHQIADELIKTYIKRGKDGTYKSGEAEQKGIITKMSEEEKLVHENEDLQSFLSESSKRIQNRQAKNSEEQEKILVESILDAEKERKEEKMNTAHEDLQSFLANSSKKIKDIQFKASEAQKQILANQISETENLREEEKILDENINIMHEDLQSFLSESSKRIQSRQSKNAKEEKIVTEPAPDAQKLFEEQKLLDENINTMHDDLRNFLSKSSKKIQPKNSEVQEKTLKNFISDAENVENLVATTSSDSRKSEYVNIEMNTLYDTVGELLQKSSARKGKNITIKPEEITKERKVTESLNKEKLKENHIHDSVKTISSRSVGRTQEPGSASTDKKSKNSHPVSSVEENVEKSSSISLKPESIDIEMNQLYAIAGEFLQKSSVGKKIKPEEIERQEKLLKSLNQEKPHENSLHDSVQKASKRNQPYLTEPATNYKKSTNLHSVSSNENEPEKLYDNATLNSLKAEAETENLKQTKLGDSVQAPSGERNIVKKSDEPKGEIKAKPSDKNLVNFENASSESDEITFSSNSEDKKTIDFYELVAKTTKSKLSDLRKKEEFDFYSRLLPKVSERFAGMEKAAKRDSTIVKGKLEQSFVKSLSDSNKNVDIKRNSPQSFDAVFDKVRVNLEKKAKSITSNPNVKSDKEIAEEKLNDDLYKTSLKALTKIYESTLEKKKSRTFQSSFKKSHSDSNVKNSTLLQYIKFNAEPERLKLDEKQSLNIVKEILSYELEKLARKEEKENQLDEEKVENEDVCENAVYSQLLEKMNNINEKKVKNAVDSQLLEKLYSAISNDNDLPQKNNESLPKNISEALGDGVGDYEQFFHVADKILKKSNESASIEPVQHQTFRTDLDYCEASNDVTDLSSLESDLDDYDVKSDFFQSTGPNAEEEKILSVEFEDNLNLGPRNFESVIIVENSKKHGRNVRDHSNAPQDFLGIKNEEPEIKEDSFIFEGKSMNYESGPSSQSSFRDIFNEKFDQQVDRSQETESTIFEHSKISSVSEFDNVSVVKNTASKFSKNKLSKLEETKSVSDVQSTELLKPYGGMFLSETEFEAEPCVIDKNYFLNSVNDDVDDNRRESYLSHISHSAFRFSKTIEEALPWWRYPDYSSNYGERVYRREYRRKLDINIAELMKD